MGWGLTGSCSGKIFITDFRSIEHRSMTIQKKIKVGLLLPCLQQGGAERFMVYLARHLDREKFDPVLILFSKSGEFLRSLPSDLRVVDLGLGIIPKMLTDNWTWARRIAASLKEIRPDILLSTIGH